MAKYLTLKKRMTTYRRNKETSFVKKYYGKLQLIDEAVGIRYFSNVKFDWRPWLTIAEIQEILKLRKDEYEFNPCTIDFVLWISLYNRYVEVRNELEKKAENIFERLEV